GLVHAEPQRALGERHPHVVVAPEQGEWAVGSAGRYQAEPRRDGLGVRGWAGTAAGRAEQAGRNRIGRAVRAGHGTEGEAEVVDVERAADAVNVEAAVEVDARPQVRGDRAEMDVGLVDQLRTFGPR